VNAAIAVAQAYDLRSNASNLWHAKPLLAEICPGDGLLLTGTGLHLIQLLSRRPILLDTDALDMLPYAPEGGPEFERILRDAYGVDFFTAAPGQAVLKTEPTKTLWESWTPADWARIRNEFNVTQVLTSADWRLQLPPIRQTSRGLILYQIPESGS